MAYDERLANRLRLLLAPKAGVSERKMFGGLAFLVDGHMCVGIVGEDLMVRVGPEKFAQALAAPHTRPMDFTGRPSKGMIYVAPAGCARGPALKKWLALAEAFVLSLPAKAPQRKRRADASRIVRAKAQPRDRKL
jgi:TfoX/Sxy family transcriptional regulator of competence genes